jgi:hypothetical protein
VLLEAAAAAAGAAANEAEILRYLSKDPALKYRGECWLSEASLVSRVGSKRFGLKGLKGENASLCRDISRYNRGGVFLS